MNNPGLTSFKAMFKRDMLIAYRHRGEVLNPILFYILVVLMFALAVEVRPAILQTIAPGVIWVAALLSALLSLDSLFRSDYEDGFLEVMLLSPHSLYLMVLAKVLAHWLVTGLPLVIIAPILAVAVNLPGVAMDELILSLLLGTPVLSLLGAIGTALILGLRSGGMLVSLLVLPLYVPILIYGAGSISAGFIDNATSQPYLLFMAAFFSIALVFAPWATTVALRISVE